MAIDPKNVGTLTCGLVADPETIDTKAGNKIVKLRVAADYAGTENGKASSGYFDVTFFAGSDQQSGFVLRQISEGKMKKGSQLQIAYRLNHERFEVNGEKRSKVSLVAEGITYAGGGGGGGAKDGGSENAPAATTREAEPEMPARW